MPVIASTTYETLIETAARANFPDVLWRMAHNCAGVTELFSYIVIDGQDPEPVASAGRGGQAAARGKSYLERYRPMDPTLTRISAQPEGASGVLRTSAREITDGAYRRECYERASLAERHCYFRKRDGATLVLNFYHGSERGEPSEALSALADIALPLLRQRMSLGEPPGQDGLLARIERRLAACFPQLTPREREVCARTVVGMTSEAIALDLDIRPSSALTYRRRAYDRLGVSSANQLLAPLIG